MAADQTVSIAMVYAEALFELTEEQSATAMVREELDGMAEIFQACPDFKLFLEAPAISRDAKTATVEKVFSGKVSTLLLNFMKVVAAKDRLSLLDEIQICFAELEDRKLGRVSGSITTAMEMSAQDAMRLNEQINRALHKSVSLDVKVDPAILGGMVLQIEDLLMDASVKGGLDQIRNKLQRETLAGISQRFKTFIE